MTGIKFCGLTRSCDIEAANALQPDYIGFVFAKNSRRFVTPDRAFELKKMLQPEISAVGVFVNEQPETIALMLRQGMIDMAQLHGGESVAYVHRLKLLTDRPLIQAFQVKSEADIRAALLSPADHILLDAGAGEGKTFDWRLLSGTGRPFFLAGGLTPENVGSAMRLLSPFAVDVSSGIETDGVKDQEKMTAFAAAVRSTDKKG